MSKGLRVLLHILQVLSLLGALVYLALTHLEVYADWGLTDDERLFDPQWAIALAVLAVAFSPALWSLGRGGAAANAAPQPVGTYDRVVEQQPPAAPQPPRPGGPGNFEPISPDRAPAPPPSSYGQPSGPGFGAQPSTGPSQSPPPSGESPWGNSR